MSQFQELANERKKKYKELKKRIEREKELHIIAQKMERKKQLTVSWNINNYVLIASLKSEQTCKPINRIPCLCLLISSLPGSALRAHVGSLIKHCGSTSVLESFPSKLDITRYQDTYLVSLFEALV